METFRLFALHLWVQTPHSLGKLIEWKLGEATMINYQEAIESFNSPLAGEIN